MVVRLESIQMQVKILKRLAVSSMI